jgi:hypothetical protein
MSKIKKQKPDNTKSWWGWANRISHSFLVVGLENSLAGSYRTKHLTIESINCTPWYLRICTENLNHTKINTQMFIEILFIITQNNQLQAIQKVTK